MKSSNLAWRIDRQDAAPAAAPAIPAIPAAVESPPEPHPRTRARMRSGRRTIEIRDQGFAPFRVR